MRLPCHNDLLMAMWLCLSCFCFVCRAPLYNVAISGQFKIQPVQFSIRSRPWPWAGFCPFNKTTLGATVVGPDPHFVFECHHCQLRLHIAVNWALIGRGGSGRAPAGFHCHLIVNVNCVWNCNKSGNWTSIKTKSKFLVTANYERLIVASLSIKKKRKKEQAEPDIQTQPTYRIIAYRTTTYSVNKP